MVMLRLGPDTWDHPQLLQVAIHVLRECQRGIGIRQFLNCYSRVHVACL